MILKFIDGPEEIVYSEVEIYKVIKKANGPVIEFQRKGKEGIKIWPVADVCFVMNDNGKTIDTIQ